MSHDATATVPARAPRLRLAIVIGLGLAIAAVAIGLSVRAVESHQLTAWTDAQLVPSVQVIQAVPDKGGQAMTLPGHLDAWISAPIHARVGGYLKNWNADIGDKVKAGDVLGLIDTPELDQQFQQAKAGLVRAQAAVRLADTTAKRWQNLLQSRSVSKQEADEKAGEAEAARANQLAAQADVDRIAALESFKRITAPFSGTVTARHTDIGDLITANSDNSPALFTVADTSKMRLYVEIPQGYTSSIKPGMKVSLTVLGHGGETVNGTLLGNSNAINQASGTMLAQFQVDNPRGDLLPGDFAEVHLPLSGDPGTTTVPATVLLFRAAGPQVAVVGKDNHVVLRDVHIAMDLGDRLLIDHGLQPGDRIVDHPSDSLSQGDVVQVEATKTEGGDHAKAG